MLFILLLCPITVYAVVTEEYCNGFTNQPEACRNIAGCQYIDSGVTTSKCAQCPEHKYCPEGHNNITQPCPTEYTESETGSVSIDECYKDEHCITPDSNTQTEQCRHYHNGDISHCATITSAHIEGESCYADTRDCELFGIAGQSCSNATEVSESATWRPSSADWYVGNCECGASPFTDNQTRFCDGIQAGVHPTGSNTTVQNATTPINYNGTSNGYHCTRCIVDTDDTKYYASSANASGCAADLTSGIVCKCETSTEHGHYRTGKCCTGSTTCPEWGSASDICTRVACDIPGTTTEHVLPTSNNNSICTYGPLTEMHDSVDDFKLQELGPNPFGWKKIY